MIARRLATAVVAVALIVGAFLIRRNVIEGDDDADAGDGPEPASELVCLTELANVCNALADANDELEITVEDAGETLDRLADGEAVPLWLTVEPFPAIDGSLRAGDVLAASQLTVGTKDGHDEVLAGDCESTALWRCIGDAVGEAWGDLGDSGGSGTVQPSVGDVDRSATALASFADAVAGYFGTAQVSTVDLQDPAFLAWVRPLVRAVPLSALSGGTPLDTMLTRRSAVNVAATSDAEISALGAPGAEVERSYPEPSMWLQAVLAAPAGVDVPEGLAAEAAAALRAKGWDPPDPATQPLPSATTMLALRTLWEEIQ
jgi:hypothetical protein